MAKDPAVLFYTADFIAGTITMSDEQRGKYILLLCIQHQKGFLTEKDMLKICKTYDIDIWDKFTKDGDQYYNERMKAETEKRLKYSESRRINRQKKDEEDKDMSNICKSYDEHMENENININIDNNRDIDKGVTGGEEKEKEVPEKIFTPTEEVKLEFYPFDEFWNDYDKKVGDKDKLRRKWENISVKNRKIIKDHIPKYKSAQPEKQYRKNPETYLNQKSWNDEVITRADPPPLRGGIKKGVSLSELEQIRQDLRQ